MGSYEDTMQKMSEMKSRFQSGFSSSDRLFLDGLHRLLFGKEITNTGCSDCYRDAYAIIFSNLKKNKKMPTTPNYILKAGALIHPFGTSKFYTNPLPSDDIAEEHLSRFPNEIIIFAHYPEDWEARVEAYKTRKAAEAIAQSEAKEKLEAQASMGNANNDEFDRLKEELVKVTESLADSEKRCEEAEEKARTLEQEKENLELQVNELQANLENQIVASSSEESEEESDELSQLRMELETAKAELEAANEEISSLKTDNRALKAANTRLKNNRAEDPE